MLLNINQVAERICLSVTSVRRMMRLGTFPAARSLLGRKKVWYPADVDSWLAKQIGTPFDGVEEKSGNWLSRWS